MTEKEINAMSADMLTNEVRRITYMIRGLNNAIYSAADVALIAADGVKVSEAVTSLTNAEEYIINILEMVVDRLEDVIKVTERGVTE